MTYQYLGGELSALLGELEATALSGEDRANLTGLRHEAETVPTTALPLVARRALDCARGLCWASLSRGDMVNLALRATVCAHLRDFVVCACLLPDE